MPLPATRICLWSSPRNVSTAFMYAFAQRSDTTVVDEPLYGYYLAETGIDHPGKSEIMASMDCDARTVIEQVLLGSYTTPVVFFKHMTHHMVGDIDPAFMQHMHNLFFIRDPKYILRSYAKVIATPTLADIGLEQQLFFVEHAQRHNYPYTVLDAATLLQDPTSALSHLCNRMGIPYDPAMTSWKPGPRKEDGIWAKFWYDNVHQSTGFTRPETDDFELPAHLQNIYAEAKPIYAKLQTCIN